VPGDPARAALVGALGFKDARLVFFAVTSLLDTEQDVPAAALEQIAASPEMRNDLMRALATYRLTDRFPAQYTSQLAFAESALASYLAEPRMLDHPPDDLTLGKIVTINGGDYYLFKFRTPGRGKAWLAGVAGPYERGAEPSAEQPPRTFTTFAAYASMTPEEHVEELLRTE
jgi:hypothetical protein